ncbi:hypothetical protein TSOC_003995 [Tetrabaena socialis]|uniref:Kinesin-like protein KIF6/9 C-terminal domain-containing protein n=1 Tax=Tetrabaena socialis TaxID=47790 RepID=A0A2J8AA62_9CHLO|nr:hypothetical protein TSOC_003995 [Tetrabaena socialis]|eukprot:PNH09409.1 hypothetical protein TSOC_003995 [Tetrabaena socialis]
MRIRELKGSYREHYNELQLVKSEVDYTQGLVDQCNKELLLEFAEWYERTYGRPPGDDHGDDGDDGPASPPSSSSGPSTTPLGSRSPAAPPAPLRPIPTSTLRAPGPGSGAARPPSPGGMSVSSAGSGGTRAAAAGPAAARQRLAGKQPLSSLLAPSGEELSSPEAMAYYSAQQLLHHKTSGAAAGHRPGSVKKTRPGPAFGGAGKNHL